MISKFKILHVPCSSYFLELIRICHSLLKRISFLLSDHIGPRNYSDYSARRPIYSKYISFWCLFLGPHLTIQHSKYVGVGNMSNRIRSAYLRWKSMEINTLKNVDLQILEMLDTTGLRVSKSSRSSAAGLNFGFYHPLHLLWFLLVVIWYRSRWSSTLTTPMWSISTIITSESICETVALRVVILVVHLSVSKLEREQRLGYVSL